MYARRTHIVPRSGSPVYIFPLFVLFLLSLPVLLLAPLRLGPGTSPENNIDIDVDTLTLAPIPFPSPGSPARCVNIVLHGADPADPNPYNARSFCMYAAPVCVVARRAENVVGTTRLSPIDLPSAAGRIHACVVTAPAMTTPVPLHQISSSVARRPNCTALADAVLCAHGAHDYTSSGGVCGTVEPLRDGPSGAGSQPGEAPPEWLPDDNTLVVVPAYPYQQNVFHFAQTLAPLLQAMATLPLRAARHVTVMFRGRNPAEYGEWHRIVATALFHRHRGAAETKRAVTFDTFFEEDLSLNRSGFKPFDEQAAKMSKPRNRNRTLCAKNVILLGPRTGPDMWPFPGGSARLQRPFTFGNYATKFPQIISAIRPAAVPALALLVRAAVHAQVALLPEGGQARHTTVHWPERVRDRERRKQEQYDLERWLRWLLKFPRSPQSGLRSALPLMSLSFVDRATNMYARVRQRRLLEHGAELHGLPFTCRFFDVAITVRPRTALLDLPPRAVLYRKRSASLTSRVLCCDGERWMLSMLRAVTKARGYVLLESHDLSGVPFAEQLAQVAGAGIVVGVHGANLVNGMLAPALGAIIEIVNAPLPCYVGGMNSGMGYWAVQPTRTASPEESNCQRYVGFPVMRGDIYNPNRTEPTDLSVWCNKSDPYRAMWLNERDREAVRESVKQAMTYVDELHKRFGETVGAVPVRYKEDGSDEYEIDWGWAQ